MHSNNYLSDYTVASRKLLFIGFGQEFDANILDFPYEDDSYHYTIQNNAQEAFEWLQQEVSELKSFQLPYAIFFRLDWLKQNQFVLPRRIASHPYLKHVPLIALSDTETETLNKAQFSSNKIDDCYTVPVNWEALESRLEFLNQFKPQLVEDKKLLKQEDYHTRISTGKRVFDIIGASLAIVLSSPIWLPVMLAIWLESRGPVVYRSKRIGSGYRVIEFLKFRSMYVNADKDIQQFQHLNLYNAPDGKGSIFIKIPKDPRTTRVGRFIRKYSIDELPQLINVIKGDMSLVGNRPLPLYEAEALTQDEWVARFLAPAGITGLWQINKRKRPKMSAEDRILLDIEYSYSKHSLLNDLKITFLTFGAFIQKEGF
ncbi:MAG: sugar transferase [Bacteroidetes bacterium]|nr:sugar transferase [Bacteroidota bacterium]